MTIERTSFYATAMVLCLCVALLRSACAEPATGSITINPKDGAEMILIPAGEFLMGSTDADKRARPWEKPQHKVYLDAYYIYKNLVTVAQYRTFCKATGRAMPSAPSWGWKDSYPIVKVTWDDAVAYAQWAGGSLPTEAQWEKAARGTDGRIYPWGNAWDPAKAQGPEGALGDAEKISPVGSFTSGASPYGALDMAGSVWQWCADWYDPRYYLTSPSRNPTGPAKGKYRVMRGGSWFNYHSIYFRAASRDYVPLYDSSITLSNGGFRCSFPAVGQQESVSPAGTSDKTSSVSEETAHKIEDSWYAERDGEMAALKSKFPGDAHPWYWAALRAYQRGKPKDAIGFVNKALRLHLDITFPPEFGTPSVVMPGPDFTRLVKYQSEYAAKVAATGDWQTALRVTELSLRIADQAFDGLRSRNSFFLSASHLWAEAMHGKEKVLRILGKNDLADGVKRQRQEMTAFSRTRILTELLRGSRARGSVEDREDRVRERHELSDAEKQRRVDRLERIGNKAAASWNRHIVAIWRHKLASLPNASAKGPSVPSGSTGIDEVPSKADRWVYIATIHSDDGQRVGEALKRGSIPWCGDEGLGSRAVEVRERDRDRAIAILKLDAEKHHYWIRLDQSVRGHPAGGK